MKTGYLLILLSLLSVSCLALSRKTYGQTLQKSVYKDFLQSNEMSLTDEPIPKVRYFENLVDHFTNIGGAGGPTYKQKYLINDQYFTNASNNAIFFYCGNEAPIESFYKSAGFLETLAQNTNFNALVIFAEHRYYGESMPFGTDTFKKQNLKYLTVEQTMMDFVKLIQQIKNDFQTPLSPVIAFGGSYGGMLASWMRMKYPHVIQGALASSAPILFFKGAISPYAYNEYATKMYKQYDVQCPNVIRKGFQVANNSRGDQDTWKGLSEIFNTCTPITQDIQIQYLIGKMDNSLGTMAMVNYPYATDFLAPLPAFPVKEACTQAMKIAVKEDEDYVKGLVAAAQVFYNSEKKCIEIDSISNDDEDDVDAWEIQTCNEMVLPQAASGITDMFLRDPWDEDTFRKRCQDKYGLTPQFDWALDFYGGRTPKKDFQHCSNIIFSNGNFDPWITGGLTYPVGNCKSYIIPNAAHHLDLRAPTDQDPEELKEVRRNEAQQIQSIINIFKAMINPSIIE